MKSNFLFRTAMKFFIKTMLVVIFPACSFANGVKIQNALVKDKDTASDLVSIEFDLSWSNSWRTVGGCPSNWDAIWIFVKYKKNCCATWGHATINATGHLATGGSTIDVPADGKGAFVYRAANGIGNMNCTAMSLRWNYGADGVGDSEILTVQVIGIEMVYVNQEPFELGGDGFPFANFSGLSDLSQPFGTAGLVNNLAITSFSNINADGPVGISGNGIDSDNNGTIDNANFPTGYNAFYVMKYEVSQGQYAHFLRLLEANQSAARYSFLYFGIDRYEISGAVEVKVPTAPEIS